MQRITDSKWARRKELAALPVGEKLRILEQMIEATRAIADSRPRKTDAAVAKNYLNETELGDLNLIVSLYLDFAELQARGRRVMTMRDWIAKLDDFMRISDREILTHAGNVSHEAARARAEAEFEKFRRIEDTKPSPVEQHFLEAIEQVKQLEEGQRAKKKKP